MLPFIFLFHPMKKLPKLIGLTVGLATCAVSSVSFAQSSTQVMTTQTVTPITFETDASSVLPYNLMETFEIDTRAKHPFKDSIEYLFKDATETSPLSPEELEVLKNFIQNNLFTIGVDISTTTDSTTSSFYGAMHVNQQIVNLITKTNIVTPNTYNGQTIYDDNSSSSFVVLGDLLVMSNNIDGLKKIIDGYVSKSTDVLGKNPDYIAANSKNMDGSFLNIYVNAKAIGQNYEQVLNNSFSNLDVIEGGEVLVKILNAQSKFIKLMDASGASVKQTDSGFTVSRYIKGNPTELQNSKINLADFDFVPELYNYISGKGVMAYGEGKNLKANLAILLAMVSSDAEISAKITEFKKAFKTETNLDWDADLMDLLSSKYAVAIHKSDVVYPSFTFMADVKSSTVKAKVTAEKLAGYIRQKLATIETEQHPAFTYSEGKVNVKGTQFIQFMIKPMNGMGTFSAEQLTLTINIGVTDSGFLIFSTLPNLDTMMQSGMTDDATFKKYFTTPTETVNGISFFNIDTLHEYVDVLMRDSDDNLKSIVDGMFAPWHSAYSKGVSELANSSIWETGTLAVDVNAFGNYPALIQKSIEMARPVVEELPSMDSKFCDVSKNDWFAEYVNNLNDYGVVKGYEDGCFRPNALVTRAEFTKMYLQAIETYAPSTLKEPSKEYFKDITNNDWFKPFVNRAAENKIINGYNDGTFRPNAPITRAEALQVLFNYAPGLDPDYMKSEPFNDVSSNEWFYKAVLYGYNYRIVSGKTDVHFAPNDLLTRAEAAKIIYQELGRLW